MTNQQKQAFLSQPATSYVMRLAQELLAGEAKNRWQIVHGIRLLSKFSYVKEMTMSEVIEALNMISEKEI